MTQQPFGFQPQQGFPMQQAPAQPMPQQPAQQFQGYPQQAPAQQPYQQAPQAPAYGQQAGGMGWQPQGYPQQFQQAPQGPPPAQGSLDAFNAQPVTGRPQGISFKGVQPGQPGYQFVGTVAKDVTDSDVAQDRDPQTQQLKFFRDGRPKFHMAITLQLAPGTYNEATFPGGLATLYVRDRMHADMSAAMASAGVKGAPKAGDTIAVALIERRAGRGTIPANIYQVQYAAGPGWQGQQAPQQAPAPVPQPSAVPAPVETIQQGQQFVQGAPGIDASAPVAQAQPVPQQAPQGGVLPPAQPGAVPLNPVPALDSDQAALLARLQQQAQG